MALQNLIVRVGADITGLTSSLRNASGQISQFARDAESGFQAVGNVGKIVAGFGVAVAGGLGVASKTAMEFESAMSRVAALSGATGDELHRLTEEAERLGETTSFSATQAAEGMQYLAMAGYKTNDIISAMPGLLAMAAAGQTELGTTADIASNILSGFGLQANETARVADVLTKAFTNSNTDLRMLGYTMKYVAPVAKAAGQSLESVAAAAGILGNAGIQADSAGTALRMMLLRLARPPRMARKALEQLGVTAEDESGNMKDLSVIIGELSEATKDMGEADRLAAISKISGTEASAAMLALMDAGQGTIEAFTKELENSGGTAEKIAAKQLDNLKGQLIILKSAFEAAAISLGNALLPALKRIASTIQSVMNWFNGLSEATKSFLAIGAALTAVFALIIGPMLIMVGFIPSIIQGFSAIAAMAGMTSLALLKLIAVVGGVVTAVIAIGAGLYIAYNEIEWFRNAVNASWAWIVNATKAVGQAIKVAFAESVAWAVQKFNDFKAVSSIIGGHVRNAIEGVKSAFSTVGDAVTGAIGSLGAVGDFIRGSFENVGNVLATISPLIARLGLTFLGVSGPIGWFIAAIISVGATIFKLVRTNEDARNALTTVWNGIKSAVQPVLDALLPVFTQIVSEFAKLGPEFAKTGQIIGESFNTLGPAFAEVGVAFGELMTAIVGIMPPIVQMAQVFSSQILPVGVQIATTVIPLMVKAFGALLLIVSEIAKGLLPLLAEVITIVLQTVLSVVMAVMPIIISFIQALIPVVTEIITNVLPVLATIFTTVFSLILSVVQAVFPVILSIIQAAIPIVMVLFKAAALVITNVLVPAIQFILKIVQAVLPAVVAIIKLGLKAIETVIKVVTAIIKGDWSAAWNAIKSFISAWWSTVKTIFSAALNVLKATISGAWSVIKGVTSTIWNSIKSLIVAVWNGIKSIVSSVISAIKSVISAGFNGMRNVVSSIMNAIRNVIKTSWNSAVSFLRGIDLRSIGRNVMQGLINGIKSMVGAVSSAVQNVGSKIKNGFKSFFGIHSPSRLMKNDIGRWIPAGVAEGMTANIRSVLAAKERLSEAMVPEVPEVSIGYNSPRLSSAGVASIDSLGNNASINAQGNSKPVYITNVLTLDGYEIARNQAPYIDAMQTTEVKLNSYMRGGKR